jgi:hypothetical protein
MRFYTRTHKHYCGVDLHARSTYVCVLDAEGNVLVSKNIAATPEPFLELIAPYREDLAVAAECMFTWYTGFMKVRYYSFLSPSFSVPLEEVKARIEMAHGFTVRAAEVEIEAPAPMLCRHCGGALQ